MAKDALLFRESQHFGGAFYVIFIASLITVYTMNSFMPGIGTSLNVAVAFFTVATVLTLNLMYMRTTVTSYAITVTFGMLFPLYRRKIGLDSVLDIEPVRYEPMADYGGWGIRGWGRRRALNARGDLGILVTFVDQSKLLIGSQVPQELAAAAQSARRRPHAGTRNG